MSTAAPEDLRRLTADLAAGQFPAHIAELPYNNKIKRAFSFFEACRVTQPLGLFPSLSKEIRVAFKGLDFKERYAFNKLGTINIWWAFFFGPFYYLVVGMWKKGLALCGGLVLFGSFDGVYYGILGAPESHAVDMGLSIGISWAVSLMATYDLYRFKLKKEDFWW